MFAPFVVHGEMYGKINLLFGERIVSFYLLKCMGIINTQLVLIKIYNLVVRMGSLL
jgi:hypothetical protein